MGALLLDPTCCMCTLPQSNANLNNDLKTKKMIIKQAVDLRMGVQTVPPLKLPNLFANVLQLEKAKLLEFLQKNATKSTMQDNGSQKRSLLNVKMIFIAHQLFLCKCQLMCK